MTRRPLTGLAHAAVSQVLVSGARAIDATMGNGHDTCHLARCVAPDGEVIAFDIQAEAVNKTAERLRVAELATKTVLHHLGHEHMLEQVPQDWPGTVSVVMFNLGYLPGGDKGCITRAETTLAALDQALSLLRPGGLLSLMLYRGHAGAASESAAVEHWVAGLDPRCSIVRHESTGPCLFLITTPVAKALASESDHSTRRNS